jgi:DNA-binding CsgD family transcriptional regulator
VRVLSARGEGAEAGAVDYLAWGASPDANTGEPTLLLLDGEPGVGKTTILLRMVAEAKERGVRVLLARPTEAESLLAYAALADLLSDVDRHVLDRLAPPQRTAVERVLSRSPSDETPTDPAATAAALLSIVKALAEESPVLLAVDDLQWVDVSSRAALSSAIQRMPLGVSALGAVRRGDGGDTASWLQPPQPYALRRVSVPAMDEAALEALVTERLGRTFSRSELQHVHRVARGNPFVALELARAIGSEDHAQGVRPLPDTLAEVVRARIGDAGPDVRRMLLAVASLAEPTVGLVQEALGLSVDAARELVEDAERRRLLETDGQRLRFTHPLLAAGVYAEADQPTRRAMHQRLAECLTEVEQRARHLALAATGPDARTLESLDSAAAAARVRGAPAAAAELLETAIRLGGDDPARHLHLAQNLVDSGDAGHALAVLTPLRERRGPGAFRARITSAIAQVHLDADSFVEAARLLEAALAETEADEDLRIEILVRLAYAHLNCGRVSDALTRGQEAVVLGERRSSRHLLALALGMREMVRFVSGDGLDEGQLDRALALEDRESTVAMALRPSVQAALLLAWTGRLTEAADRLAVIRQGCLERGQEHALMFLDFQRTLVEGWRGGTAEIQRLEQECDARAQQLGGDMPHAVAHTVSGIRAAFAGQVDEARAHAWEGAQLFQRCGMQMVSGTPVAVVGFLEVSRGDHRAALAALEPVITRLVEVARSTETMMAGCLPDAVEAMVALGRVDEAEVLVEMLERNGSRLDRAWMLAVGSRGRSLVLAAGGDLEAALAAAHHALAEHERLAMPFERARTQLVLGQVQRRLRQKEAASRTLRDALATFEKLETPLWAERCRAELDRVGQGRRSSSLLTSSEQRVAELAARGMTNREAAAALFISPKTVEANLARVYRKLGIRSRAELGHRMGSEPPPTDVSTP